MEEEYIEKNPHSGIHKHGLTFNAKMGLQLEEEYIGKNPRPGLHDHRLIPHCKDKITKFRNKYSGLSPNFHIHASTSDLYIPTICLPILLEEICRPILGLYISLTDTLMLKLGLRPRYSQKWNT